MNRNVVSRWSTIAALLLGSLSLIACGDDDGGGDDDVNTDPLTGPYTHYVNDSVQVPQDSADTRKYGLNIDGDDADRPDNALGGILAALKGQGVDIQTTVTESVAAGNLVLLHSLQADDLTSDTSAGWKVLLGDPVTGPDFGGTGAFTVSATSPTDSLLRGSISGGQFQGGPGDITIQLALTAGTPIKVKLIGARLKANVTATGCTDGVLGGAITDAELNSSVIPGIQVLMNASVQEDAPEVGGELTACVMAADVCPDNAGGDPTTCDVERMICRSSTTKTILDLFDANDDAEITVAEIKDNTLIKALLAPDVDLLNAAGTFEPRVDGVKDSLSVGLGFTCANGVFTVSGE